MQLIPKVACILSFACVLSSCGRGKSLTAPAPGNLSANDSAYIMVVDGLDYWKSARSKAPLFNSVKTRGVLEDFTVESANNVPSQTDKDKVTDEFKVHLKLANADPVETTFVYVLDINSGHTTVREE